MCYQFSFKNATSASDKLQNIGLAGAERGAEVISIYKSRFPCVCGWVCLPSHFDFSSLNKYTNRDEMIKQWFR